MGIRNIIQQLQDKPGGYTVADAWETTCDKFPHQPAIQYVGCELFPERRLSYAQLEAYANQVSFWAHEHEGLRCGDSVALFLESRLEYVALWLGLTKIGVRVALINSTIKLDPLVHSIAISDAKMVIFGSELTDVMTHVHSSLVRKHGIESVCVGASPPFCRGVDARIAVQPVDRPPRAWREGTKFDSIFGYIYTSGTTGLPKAVKMTHYKMWMYGAPHARYLSEDDVVYTSGMPLYHSSAGGIGTLMAILSGACLVVRRKFSASLWLSDVRKYRVTMFQYIGEICRYIMSQPASPLDKDHCIKFATGNGLRPEYWVEFQTRFRVGQIFEFYGSTEGNGGLHNVVLLKNIEAGNLAGVGCIGNVKRNFVGFRVAKFDVEEGCVVRDTEGRLVEAPVNEPGEAIFPVRKGLESKFSGYTSKEATEKKILRDCFEAGDVFIRTGDLMTVDEDKWVRFVDRIGDTFRWKGENVSTSEVATELSKFKGVEEVNVYGVQIPNNLDGRAGMAAVVMNDTSQENLDRFLEHAKEHLPSYSVPLFIRCLPEIHITATFKHQKVKLRKEGIDLAHVHPDPIFWLDPVEKRYKPFREHEYQIATRVNSRL